MPDQPSFGTDNPEVAATFAAMRLVSSMSFRGETTDDIAEQFGTAFTIVFKAIREAQQAANGIAGRTDVGMG